MKCVLLFSDTGLKLYIDEIDLEVDVVPMGNMFQFYDGVTVYYDDVTGRVSAHGRTIAQIGGKFVFGPCMPPAMPVPPIPMSLAPITDDWTVYIVNQRRPRCLTAMRAYAERIFHNDRMGDFVTWSKNNINRLAPLGYHYDARLNMTGVHRDGKVLHLLFAYRTYSEYIDNLADTFDRLYYRAFGGIERYINHPPMKLGPTVPGKAPARYVKVVRDGRVVWAPADQPTSRISRSMGPSRNY